MSESQVRLAMLISGGGSTMQAIAESCQSGKLRGHVHPVLVLASRNQAAGIQKAQSLGIPVEVVARKDFPQGLVGIEPYGEALRQTLAAYQPDVVILTGFLSQLSESVIADYQNNIFNQHPGPVPEFGGQGMYGRRVHAAVLLFIRITGRRNAYTELVAQRVHKNYDEGAVVKLARLKIHPGDTVETLQQRALPVEHQLQIDLLEDVANGTVREIIDRPPYAMPQEYTLLQRAREVAQIQYPHG